MKQTYVKPKIFVERFSLTQSIAQYCGPSPAGSPMGNNLHSNPEMCYWELSNVDTYSFKLFTEGNHSCTDVQLKDGEEFNGYCYNNPTASTALFASV